MKGQNQLDSKREDVHVTAADLLAVPPGTRTEAGLRHNVRVGVQYLEAWLRGLGCVPLYNLMEDAATAEISRAQVWQWMHHGARLEDGESSTEARVRALIDEEIGARRSGRPARRESAPVSSARRARLFEELRTLRSVRRVPHAPGVRALARARRMRPFRRSIRR